MTSLTIEFTRNGDTVVASTERITVSRQDAATAARDLVLAWEAVDGPLSSNVMSASQPKTSSRWMTSASGMRALIEEALDGGDDLVYIEGSHADGSPMQSRVIEPQELDGNLIGAYDYLTRSYRNFRLDKLTLVSVHPDDIQI